MRKSRRRRWNARQLSGCLRPFLLLAALAGVAMLLYGILGQVVDSASGSDYLEPGIAVKTGGGRVSIHFEHPYSGEESTPDVRVPETDFLFRDIETGREYRSERPEGTTFYTIGSERGVKVASLRIPAGTYTVHYRIPEGTPHQFVLSEGSFGGTGGRVGLMLLGFALALCGFMAWAALGTASAANIWRRR